MKLLWKLLLSAAVLVLLTAVVVGALATRWTEALTLQEIRRSLRHQTLTLSETVAHAPAEADLQPLVLRLGAQVETRLTVIRDDGVVLADSERPPASSTITRIAPRSSRPWPRRSAPRRATATASPRA